MWDRESQDSSALGNLRRLKQLGSELAAKEKIDHMKTKIETEVRERAYHQRRLHAGEGRARLAELCGKLVGDILDGVSRADPAGESGVQIGRATLEYAFPNSEAAPPEGPLERSKWDILDYAAVRVQWLTSEGARKSRRSLLLYANGGPGESAYSFWELRFGDNPFIDHDRIPRLGPKLWFPDVKSIDAMIAGPAADNCFVKESNPKQISDLQEFCDRWWGLFCEALEE